MMRDMANYAIDVASNLGASYADVRVIATRHQTIETRRQVLSGFVEDEGLGLGVRVLVQGGWGFAAAQKLTKKGIYEAVKVAVATAAASARCLPQPVDILPEPAHNAVWISPYSKDPFAVSTQEKLAVLAEASRNARQVKGVCEVEGTMSFIRKEQLFVSSEGSSIRQTFITSSCGLSVTASIGGELQTRSFPSSFGGQYELGGFEVIEKWDLPGQAARLGKEAVRLCKAPPCPQKTTDLILGGSQLALQIHESCGHPSELDRALGFEVNMAGVVPHSRQAQQLALRLASRQHGC